jgi:hypothetical protein
MKGRLLTFCITAVLLTTLPVAAQPLPMGHWLNTGSHQERVQKLVSLGIEQDAADLAAYDDEVVWRTIRAASRHRFAVLFLPCGGLFTASLHVLEKGSNGWHVADSVGFDCHYDSSVSFETVALRNSNTDDVLVHHDCVEHGTGFVQQNFHVLAIRSGKLKVVLDAEEVTDDQGSSGEAYQFRQRSKFAPVLSTQSGSGIIEETRCEKVHGRRSIQKRQFSWNEHAFRFLPTKFAKLSLTDGEAKASCQ